LSGKPTNQELGTVLWENRLYPRGSEEESFRPGECILTLVIAARREVLPSMFKLVASVCFSLLSVQASGAQQPQENSQSRYFIERVELIGNRRIETETLLARISSRPGDPYSVEAVRRDVQALWSTQFFDDVRFEVKDSLYKPNGKIVMFSMKEKSDIARIATAQAQTIPEQIWGKWVISRKIPTTTISCWDEAEAKTLLGTQIEYSSEVFRWKDVVTAHPTAEAKMVSAEQFHDDNSGKGSNSSQITFRQLGITAKQVMLISIHHPPANITGGTIEIPGDEVLVKNKDAIIFAACNVYFEAKRASAQSTPD
jgi:Surface antigen variable number repeat